MAREGVEWLFIYIRMWNQGRERVAFEGDDGERSVGMDGWIDGTAKVGGDLRMELDGGEIIIADSRRKAGCGRVARKGDVER